MHRLWKGTALLLFGILLMLVEGDAPWIPVIGDVPWNLLALLSGIAGLVLVLTGGKDE